MHRGWMMIAVIVLALNAAGQNALPAEFISAETSSDEADNSVLIDYLQERAGLEFRRPVHKDYSGAIVAVTERPAGSLPYVARLTPFAFVAAELLGARFDPIATYERSGNVLTYRSWLVVRKSDFTKKPEPAEIAVWLRRQKRKFAYHDLFSTSSYFIPSLWFRQQGLFHFNDGTMATSFPIAVTPLEHGSGSSDLVKKVEDRTVDIAAVWDKTKEQADDSTLWFVALDNVLPNDLLVVSRDFTPEKKTAIRNAMQGIKRLCGTRELAFQGDVRCWVLLDEAKAKDARVALAELRRLALPQKTNVTVDVVAANENEAERYRPYIDAARHAILFAGTEFVPYEKDFHKDADVRWTLQILHEGALRLTSHINIGSVKDQKFNISYSDIETDLPRRIEERIHSGMNRIRYVWPYQRDKEEDELTRRVTVLRDLNLTLEEKTPVVVQGVTWVDAAKHHLKQGAVYESFVVKSAGLRHFKLESPIDTLQLDPMSNVVYRVILPRPRAEMPMMRNLTLALVILFVAAMAAVIVEMVRSRRRAKSIAPVANEPGSQAPPAPAAA